MIRFIFILVLMTMPALADNNSGSYTNMLRWRQEEPSESKQSRIERLEAEIKRLREELRCLRDTKCK